MAHKSITIAAACFALAAAAAAEDAISMEPGQWTFSNTMTGQADMGGGQTFAMPATTSSSTECISPEEATITPERMIEEMQEGGSECDYGDIVFAGNTMSTTMSCSTDGIDLSGDYTFTVSADRRAGEGKLALNGTADGMAITSTFVMSGEYVGACS